MTNEQALTIVNSINKEMNNLYDYNFPIFEDNNFKAMAGALQTAPQKIQNAYIDTLSNLLCVGIIKKVYSANNPFKFLYGNGVGMAKAQMADGRVIEEVAIDQFIPIAYDMKGNAEEFFEGAPPQLKVQFLCNVLRKKYVVTLNTDLLIAAFEDTGSLENMLTAIMDRIYSDMEEDDKEEIITAINGVIEMGNMYIYPLARPADNNTAIEFSKHLDILQYDLGFDRSRDYNLQHISTKTDQKDAVLILAGDVIATNANYNLAFAFNKNYLDLLEKGQLIKLSSRGLADKRVYGIYTDKDYFRINNVNGFPKLKVWENGQNLEEKRWLHNWKMVAFSYASNAIAFVDPADVGVDSVQLKDEDGLTASTVKAGKFKKLALPIVTPVTGKLADCFVEYTLAGATSANTRICEDGHIYIGKDETVGGTITITAASHLDKNKTAVYTITVG